MPCVDALSYLLDNCSALNDWHLRHWREKQCGEKRGHATKILAKQAAKAYRRQFGERVNYYECPWCARWHIGHQRRAADF